MLIYLCAYLFAYDYVTLQLLLPPDIIIITAINCSRSTVCCLAINHCLRVANLGLFYCVMCELLYSLTHMHEVETNFLLRIP